MPVDSKTLDSPWLLLTDRLVRAGRLLDAVGWQKGWPLPAESSDPGGDLYSALSFIQPDIRAHDIIDLLAPLWIEWSAEVGGLLDDTMGPGVPAGVPMNEAVIDKAVAMMCDRCSGRPFTPTSRTLCGPCLIEVDGEGWRRG